MNLESQIESILFFRGEPVTKKKLADFVGKSLEEVDNALNTLETVLSLRGLRLLRKDDEVVLVTAPENSELLEKITKEELTRDIGKAGLETLAIVLYKGPVSRREIDYIRGVNSTFILRNLQVRGLVEKISSDSDERIFLYRPTFELLAYLGVTKIEDLPEWQSVKNEIANFENTNATKESDPQIQTDIDVSDIEVAKTENESQ